MKLLVMSDSHHRKNSLSDIIDAHKDADVLVFLGDGIRDFDDALSENGIRPEDPSKEIAAVLGNCDSFMRSVEPLIREFDGVRFYITHGAAENVKLGYWGLVEEAKRFGCQVALFGHTHTQTAVEKNGVRLFNPGAVEKGEYGIIETDREGNLSFSHHVLS